MAGLWSISVKIPAIIYASSDYLVMAGLPKKYIDKYGISKEAWAKFRADKGKKSKPASNGNHGGKHMSKSILSMGRGAAYLAIPGVQAWNDYNNLIAGGRTSQQAIKQAGMAWLGYHAEYQQYGTGEKWSWGQVATQWGPVAIWTGIDIAASKLGVWRRIGQLLPSI